MNFIRHQSDIKKLLTTQGGRSYSGCYVYSRDQNDKTHKIGMSQAGLFRRIKQAGSCYPYKSEFWLEYVIISLDGHYTKGKKSTTIHIENALHNESKHVSTVKMQEDTEKERGHEPTMCFLETTSTTTNLPQLPLTGTTSPGLGSFGSSNFDLFKGKLCITGVLLALFFGLSLAMLVIGTATIL